MKPFKTSTLVFLSSIIFVGSLAVSVLCFKEKIIGFPFMMLTYLTFVMAFVALFRKEAK